MVILFVATFFALSPASCPRAAAQEELTFIFTNDWHGAVRATPALWLDSKRPPMLGGPGALATFLQERKLETLLNRGRYLVVDSGDRFQGSIESNLSGGRIMTDLYNALRFDIVALGNHDFDHDLKALRESQTGARFPLVCANLRETSVRGNPLWKPSSIFQLGRFRIGVTAAITEDLPILTFPRNIEGTVLEPVIPAVRRESARLRGLGCDLVILLSHCGHDRDREIAKSVPDLDIIVGGHTDHHLVQPVRIGKTLIAQTRGYGTHAGVLTLFPGRSDSRFWSLKYRLFPLDEARYPPDPSLERIVSSYSASLVSKVGRKVGELDSPLLKDGPPGKNLADILCKAVLEKCPADGVIFQRGGIRTDLPGGSITFGDVYKVLPFDHHILLTKLSGRELEAVVGRGIQSKGLAFAGLDIQESPGGKFQVKVGGKPISPEGTYTLLINDYLAQGGDGYKELRRPTTDSGHIMRDVFMEFLSRGSSRF